jgi:hypothetical protein
MLFQLLIFVHFLFPAPVPHLFNSAPTLVERQRENLTQRLKREFGLFLSDDEEQEKARKQGGHIL